MKNILLLASQSRSRRMLLSQIGVPFVLLDQDADEGQCDWGLPLPKLVESIAKHKMDQVIMPHGSAGQELFVLTADTLTQDLQGNMLGKPHTPERAMQMIRAVRQGALVATAFILDKKIYQFDAWQIKERVIKIVEARLVYDVPEQCIAEYIKNTNALSASGAITIEGYGAQFLKEVDGSYSTIVGLPLFELREALEQLDFY